MTGSGPDGVLRLAAGELRVALWIDHTYTRGSADNVHAYDREVVFADGGPHSWQAVGVRVSEGERVLGSAVLLLPLGCGEPGRATIVARPHTLYLPAGTEVAALDLPSLEVRWRTESSIGCVMGLHERPDDEGLIVHGEISVARVEPDGRVAWEHAGRDIFSGALRIAGDAVEVTDQDGELHRFRVSDGEILQAPPSRRTPEPPPARGWMDRLRGWLG
ncbi:MAG TPA: hypothetical protein VFY65_18785 [Longimicrobium sp.]|nr:hypothetical protein [Longimicrobium sp.]